MTKRELMQLYYLNHEIMNDTEELVKLKIKTRSLGDTPWAKEQEKLISERERELIEKVRRCKNLRCEINKFINSVDDSLTRQILYYRYGKCMTWKQVSYMTGGYNSEDGVRKIAERYLSSISKK